MDLADLTLDDLLELRDDTWPKRQAHLAAVADGGTLDTADLPPDPRLWDALAQEVHARDIDWHDFLNMRRDH